MGNQPVRDPATDHLLTPQNSTLIIIDYQPVQVTSVASMDRRALVTNIVSVAKLAALFEIPVVLSTVNVKSGKNAPTIHQLQEILKSVETFDRTTINAWEDEQFLNAVKKTGRKKLIMTGLWTEACLARRKSLKEATHFGATEPRRAHAPIGATRTIEIYDRIWLTED